ncbi:MAG: heparinase [Gammaproteobacteria bacterium]|nr:heparinase [Gammaproteobacteria bacterium]
MSENRQVASSTNNNANQVRHAGPTYSMKRPLLIFRVLPRFGWVALARYARHRLQQLGGYYRLALPIRPLWRSNGDVFVVAGSPALKVAAARHLQARADSLLAGELLLFSHWRYRFEQVPDWHFDPVHQVHCLSHQHWSAMRLPSGIDLKCVWEASRFEWAPTLAQAWRMSGDRKYLQQLNRYALDWLKQNPANQGVNWRCGQEVSIRLINLLLAWWLLEKPAVAPLSEIAAGHLRRIGPTMSYALAQDNNHGVSEAAGLFIGGAWLARYGTNAQQTRLGKSSARKGRKCLHKLVHKLIFKDGGFAQYSCNYHRLLLDTLSQVEFWRRELGQEDFGGTYRSEVQRAIDWLIAMVDPASGAAPNLGANDGARLYRLDESPYEDFRPTLTLASALFMGEQLFDDAGSLQAIRWLGATARPTSEPLRSSKLFPDFGLAVLRRGDIQVFIRYASYRFRPSQEDCLHVDVFHCGQNILCDSGSYSYREQRGEHYSRPHAHNTVTFDCAGQMPRIGKFLYGHWSQMEQVGAIEEDAASISWTGAYRDHRGNWHRRSVTVRTNEVEVEDTVISAADRVCVHWHLPEGKYALSRYQVTAYSIAGSPSLVSPVFQMYFSGVDNVALSPAYRSTKYQQEVPSAQISATFASQKKPESGDGESPASQHAITRIVLNP